MNRAMETPAQAPTSALKLADVLFGKGEHRVFAVLDGASSPQLLKNLYGMGPEYCCLYRGELEPDIATVAPYLVRMNPSDKFTDWVLAEGWGVHWGIFAVTSADLRTMRDHLRQFHTVELPDQRTVLFRYYDPRVLRCFLPPCNEAELKTFFGPVRNFIVEGELPGSGTRFEFNGKALKSEPFQLKPPS